jgi:6-phosphogluconolactonase
MAWAVAVGSGAVVVRGTSGPSPSGPSSSGTSSSGTSTLVGVEAIEPVGNGQVTAAHPTGTEDRLTLLVGTYTGGDSRGVYRLELNRETGQLTQMGLLIELEHPSFLAASPGFPGHFAAVHETGRFADHPGGGVSLLHFDRGANVARVVTQRLTHGGAPCHVVMDSTGERIAVANYSGGSYSIYRGSRNREHGAQQPPEQSGSSLGLSEGFCYQNTGSSVNAQRQEAPHGHCVRFVPGHEDLLVAADLGTDEVILFRVSETQDDVMLEKISALAMPAGCGPRQIDFHPNGQWMYVINELDNTIAQVSFPAPDGSLTLLSMVGTLPRDFSAGNSTAHIQVHPSGKYVYGSNRGHNSIAMFQVDEGSGKLRASGHCLTGGEVPRHFLVEPGGRYLLVANQATDNVVVFPISPTDGTLGPSQFQAHVPTPVCLLPLPE